jgi:hypothetical protein
MQVVSEPMITVSNLIAILGVLVTLFIAVVGWFIAKCATLRKELDGKLDKAALDEYKKDIIRLVDTFEKSTDRIESRIDKLFMHSIDKGD